ncbi:CRISPR-associated helicase Cas3' [Marinimicrococcus flavescens]|uniref:CRISPR-associated helicase Cas3 n=1 Tax=Marinimicrococcus flavescens TaxID=3031815 RepID=A0AAP3XRU3_9PROT|nr:CRISPR-associated helicase Cas3' [Marinimicrococcus flavescens]
MEGRPGTKDLWGKFRDEARGGPAWHPLSDHAIDVAGTLAALLAQPTLRRRLAHAGGLSALHEGQVARLCHLAFLHDLGKCSRGFRAKAVPGLGPPCGHLAALRPLWQEEGPELAAFLGAIDAEQINAWAGEGAVSLLLAVFAHHGRTPDLCYKQGEHAFLHRAWTAGGREPLRRLKELAEEGRRLFPEAFCKDVPPLPDTPAFQHLFAGLLMLADWLGSDDGPERFPYSRPGDPPRAAFVRARAPDVLRAVGLEAARPPGPLLRFEAQFPFPPRAAQEAMDRLALPGEEGSLVLLESETGSGKTEAALRWASRLMEAGLVDGCFFAVPLRSAAVQLHRRMQDWLDATFGAAAQEALLAVPGYYLMGKAEGQRLPEFRVQWSDAETSDRRGSRWAAEHPKRYAAAGFAVGTIDQALLGALQVKHAHLRAACLVRHLLVIDEVHASDAYMTALTGRLLALFRACGGHVLLMSATLGADSRARLLDGALRPPPLAACRDLPYPRITASHAAPVDLAGEGTAKPVELAPLPAMGSPALVAERAAAAVSAGARVVVLHNTVAAAIATQEALEAVLGPDHPALFRVENVPTLHHGRFAAEDRRLLDAAVEDRFGRNGPPGPAVIVATQTLEQSLDIDADLMITDLCPVDVLLQRIGRLHRHTRCRPAGYGTARCLVLVPEDGDLAPRLQRPRDGIGRERAYENVPAVEATRRLVGTGAVWRLPADNRRLVEEGTHPDSLEAIAKKAGPAWERYAAEQFGRGMQTRAQGINVAIDYGRPFAELAWPGAAEHIATRLGAADLLLPLDPPMRSPFGGELTHLKIPHWMLPRGLDAADAALQVEEGGELRLGERRYRYDRLGLRHDRDAAA